MNVEITRAAPAFTLVGAMKLCALLLTSPHPLSMELDRLAGIDRSRLRPATKITTQNLSIPFPHKALKCLSNIPTYQFKYVNIHTYYKYWYIVFFAKNCF